MIGQARETFSAPEHREADDDRPRLECGVFGVYDVPDASAVAALGLHALQHRGQEACGIASFDGNRFHTERHMGHVGDAFADRLGAFGGMRQEKIDVRRI